MGGTTSKYIHRIDCDDMKGRFIQDKRIQSIIRDRDPDESHLDAFWDVDTDPYEHDDRNALSDRDAVNSTRKRRRTTSSTLKGGAQMVKAKHASQVYNRTHAAVSKVNINGNDIDSKA